jgi:hypothetical protein
MDIISYIHKSVQQLFQILELIEVWTHRSIDMTIKIVAYIAPSCNVLYTIDLQACISTHKFTDLGCMQ